MSTQGQYVDGLGGSRCLWKQQRVEAWAWRIYSTGQKTTENLQQCWESRRSPLFFFCSRTIPAEGVRRVTLSPHILGTNYWSAFSILPSMHHEILGLQGERCRHLLEINQEMWEKIWLSRKPASKVFFSFFLILFKCLDQRNKTSNLQKTQWISRAFSKYLETIKDSTASYFIFISNVMGINSWRVQHSLYDLSPFMCSGCLKGLLSTQFHAAYKRQLEVLTQTEVSIKQKTTTKQSHYQQRGIVPASVCTVALRRWEIFILKQRMYIFLMDSYVLLLCISVKSCKPVFKRCYPKTF